MSKLRVLYVDDDPDIRTIALLSLRLYKDVDARAVATAREALDLLRGGEWQPDAVLLDVMMPGTTGPELNAAIRAEPGLAGLAVIYVTARARDTDIAAYLASGVAGVIIKPFDPVRLVSELRAILNQRLARLS